MLRFSRVGIAVLALGGALAAAACTSSPESTPSSEFPAEQRFSRSVIGHVYSDVNPVSDALVRMDVNPNSAADRGFGPAPNDAFTTNGSGYFQFENSPFAYDLGIRVGRRLVVFPNLVFRYFDAQIGEGISSATYVVTLVPSVTSLPNQDVELAYLASGADAVWSKTNANGKVDIGLRSFESTVTLHVVAYPKGGTLANAVAYGNASILARSGGVTGIDVRVDPISQMGTTTIAAEVPAGLSLDSIDVGIDFGVRSISTSVTSVSSGKPFSVPLIPFARWFAEARASSGKATSDSGRFFFDPNAQPGVTVVLAPVPTPKDVVWHVSSDVEDADASDSSSGAWAVFGEGTGVREHRFEPVAHDGPSLSLFTVDPRADLPDPRRFGFERLAGTYTWTMRHFPNATRMIDVQGVDGFTFQPSATSTPRTVELR